jgi:hypothetical protein
MGDFSLLNYPIISIFFRLGRGSAPGTWPIGPYPRIQQPFNIDIALSYFTVDELFSTGIPWDIPRLLYPFVETLWRIDGATKGSEMCAGQEGFVTSKVKGCM